MKGDAHPDAAPLGGWGKAGPQRGWLGAAVLGMLHSGMGMRECQDLALEAISQPSPLQRAQPQVLLDGFKTPSVA